MPLTERDLEHIDPLRLDREIASAAATARVALRALARVRPGDEGNADLAEEPFFASRLVTTRTAFAAVSELPEADPLRAPLRRFIYRLADIRIQWAATARVTAERRLVLRGISEPEHARMPLAEVLARALGEAPRRAEWLRSFTRAAEPLGDAEAVFWERRQEIAARMGVATPDTLELPNPGVADAARGWLELTGDAFREFVRPGFAQLLDVALATRADEGWPRRLAPDTILDLFRSTDLLRSLDLDPGALPAAVAPASFVRALRRVGAAWVDATAPADQPFVIAHDPYGMRRRTMGALLGSLPGAPAFAKRALGIDPGRIPDHARELGAALLVDSRAAALRVLLRGPALAGRKPLRESFEGLTEHAIGIALPPPLAGALFRLRPDDAQRFAGLLEGARLAARLRDVHDEDWYRNPRAVEQLRDEAKLSPEAGVTKEALAGGAEALRASIVAALR